MAVEYLDPRSEPGLPESPYTLRFDAQAERPVLIGLYRSFVRNVRPVA